MTALFILAGIIWACVLVYALPGALSAFGRSPRRGDPMRAGVACIALMVLSGAMRWLLAPDDLSLLAAVFVLVCCTGVFVLILMRTYGRGGHVR
jgi:hypothetical protein